MGIEDVRLPEGLSCEGERRIERMCINPHCHQPSLTCYDDDCQACKSDSHIHCCGVKLKGVTDLLNKRVSRQRNFVNNVSEIEDQFIALLQQTRQPISE